MHFDVAWNFYNDSQELSHNFHVKTFPCSTYKLRESIIKPLAPIASLEVLQVSDLIKSNSNFKSKYVALNFTAIFMQNTFSRVFSANYRDFQRPTL